MAPHSEQNSPNNNIPLTNGFAQESLGTLMAMRDTH